MITSTNPDVSDRLRVRPAPSNYSRIPFTGLLTNEILTGLPGADFAQLLPYLEPVSLRTNEYVYESGQDMAYVYFPESLVISQLCYLKDGSSTGVATIGKDGLLGLSGILNQKTAQHWAIATIGGSALRMRTQELQREFLKGGAVHKAVLTYANSRLSQLAQRTICNSRHRLEERLCTWLLMIQDRTSNTHLPLTHEAISQHLGTRRAGVTNFCNVLRDNGIITYHRALITILDRKRLEDAACECYRKLS
jgi:CRP-like cAMP-binding protein